MTVSLANDLTQLQSMDATGVPADFVFDGSVFKSGGAVTTGQVEGSGCIEIRVNATGQGFMGIDFNATVTSLGDDHLLVWFRESFEYDTFAANGMYMGIAADLGALPADYGAWQTQGADRSISCYDGWVRACINPYLAFDVTQGTPPARTSFTHGHTRMQMEAFGRDVAMFDSFDHGGVNTITGGTVAAPGKFSEIATADRAATITGGLWKNKIGIYFVTLKTILGDVGTAESNITETNQTIVYEYNRVQGHIQEMEIVGNSTSSLNKVLFGTITGTGVDEVGSAGINVINAGVVPNHFTAVDENCDEMRLVGSTFLGPAAVYEDALMTCWSFTAAVFVDETVDINDAGASDVFQQGAVGDYIAFGHAAPFDAITVVGGGVGAPRVVVWEYSTGTSTWSNLTDLTDGTDNFKNTGTNEVTYAMPADWAEGTLNAVSRFYIRGRITTASASFSLSSATLRFTGRVRLEHTNVKCISTNFTNMGIISARNSVKVKKCAIVDSLAPAKSAALDLGSVDPPTDTVRENTLSGGSKGVLLKDHTRFFDAGAAVDKGGGLVGIPSTAHGFPDGQEILIAGTANYNGVQTVDATSSANEIVITDTFVAETFAVTDSAVPNTTFNIPNFQFSGFTNDFRVDYPATSTVNINLLDGTASDTALTPANQDNVNSSTLVINNNVVLKVTITNQAGNPQLGILVRYEQSDGTAIADGSTDASGVFSFSIDNSLLPYTNAKITTRDIAFEDKDVILTMPSGGFDIPIGLEPDGQTNLP